MTTKNTHKKRITELQVVIAIFLTIFTMWLGDFWPQIERAANIFETASIHYGFFGTVSKVMDGSLPLFF